MFRRNKKKKQSTDNGREIPKSNQKPTKQAKAPASEDLSVLAVEDRIAIYDYSPSRAGELGFKTNDVLTCEITSGDWWQATHTSTNDKGYVPSNYLSANGPAVPARVSKVSASSSSSSVKSPLSSSSSSLVPPNAPHHPLLDATAQHGCVPAYFHGMISSVDADTMLSGKPPGTFLVRLSSSRTQFSASYVRRDTSIRHARFDNPREGGFAFSRGMPAFPTPWHDITDRVVHRRETSSNEGVDILITLPLVGKCSAEDAATAVEIIKSRPLQVAFELKPVPGSGSRLPRRLRDNVDHYRKQVYELEKDPVARTYIQSGYLSPIDPELLETQLQMIADGVVMGVAAESLTTMARVRKHTGSAAAVVHDMIKPATLPFEVKFYAALLGRRDTMGFKMPLTWEASHFASHAWQAPISCLASSISEHSTNLTEGLAYYWIDLFCKDQNNASPSMEEFQRGLDSTIGTVVALDCVGSASPFQRIWCLLEMFFTINNGSHLYMQLPSDAGLLSLRDRTLFKDAVGYNGVEPGKQQRRLLELISVLSEQISPRQAHATERADVDMIHGLIEGGVGFDKMEEVLRASIDQSVYHMVDAVKGVKRSLPNAPN
eukprot:m.39554 g.39554  ORF g.39554 m.39554 type:complete len:603 (+) comp11282_c0_seq2:297-2105(+)